MGAKHACEPPLWRAQAAAHARHRAQTQGVSGGRTVKLCVPEAVTPAPALNAVAVLRMSTFCGRWVVRSQRWVRGAQLDTRSVSRGFRHARSHART